MEPVLPFTRAEAVTGQLRRACRGFFLLGALRGISMPQISAFHSCRIAT